MVISSSLLSSYFTSQALLNTLDFFFFNHSGLPCNHSTCPLSNICISVPLPAPKMVKHLRSPSHDYIFMTPMFLYLLILPA